MADYFLNKIGSKLSSVQGRQVMRQLEQKRKVGELRTLDELRDKLKKLTNDLIQNKIKPTFKVWPGRGREDISSEKYNDMLERLENDLETAFEEGNNLYEILDTHNFLIKEVALRNIESGINSLEAQISLYEFLINSEETYDDGIFNTFRDSTGSFIDSSATVAKFLFVDHRLFQSMPLYKRANIDLAGEKLIMSDKTLSYISPRGAEHLAGSYSTRSEVDAYFPSSSILNLIDGRVGTYWAVPILLANQASNGVYAEVAIDLPSAQDITFVEIEPASGKPLVLQSIAYLDSAKQTRQLLSAETVLNKEKMKIFFDKVNTSRVFMRFQQKNFTELQFEQGAISNTNKVVSSDPYTRPQSIDLDNDVINAISSPFLVKDILGLTAASSESKRYYEYLVALDNIKVGTNTFHETSVFASNKKHVKDLRQIALRVDEHRPQETFVESSAGISLVEHTYPARTTTEDQIFYHGSVEYSAIIELLNQANEVEATAIVPVLPLDAQRIYHERLVFTNRITTTGLLKDAGSLRFYCDEDSTDVVVYRNGLPLTYTSDWTFVANGHASGLTVQSAGTGTRMKRGIKISSRERQSDIYTVSYSPKLPSSFLVASSGNDLLHTVDLVGDLSIRMTPKGTIIVEPDRVSSAIVAANVYLQIFMRRNSQNDTISPVVEEFLLAVCSKDQEKYTKEIL